MRSGTLNRIIDIEQVTEARDTRGETTKSWTVFKRVHASILPFLRENKSNESFLLHEENNSITHKLTIRYQSGFSAKMRVNYGGRIFDIELIINVAERNKQLQLMCVERL